MCISERLGHYKTGHVYVKQHPGDAQLSLDELRDMVGREGEAFSKRVLAIIKPILLYSILVSRASVFFFLLAR